MNIMAKKLNFTWGLSFPKHGEYGMPQPNGLPDGVVGDISKKKFQQFSITN